MPLALLDRDGAHNDDVSIDQAHRAEDEARHAERETVIAEQRFADVRALANSLMSTTDSLAGATSTREVIVGRAADSSRLQSARRCATAQIGRGQ